MLRLSGLFLALVLALPSRADGPPLIRSAKSGPWSAGATWEGGKVPGSGERVQVRTGHSVVYDLSSDKVIRSIHVAGTLSFARERDTRLDVGLIKIQPGDDASEDGFNCDEHPPTIDPAKPKPALEIGTLEQPLAAGRKALIRLTYVDGLDKKTCPAIVCCGGRLDLHGAAMNRTWVKLGGTAKVGERTVSLAEAVTGWKAGDRVIVTATRGDRGSSGTRRPGAGAVEVETEERTIEKIDGTTVTLDKPLAFEHRGEGEYLGEVANLSRNVVVESADPKGVRGHTMYHRDSAGSIGYAEFRHLGKEGELGKYSLHYHLCSDTMRGSSVIGASIWDSHNRWLTIHGTDYMVVRDCVGYQSVGHGFFLEDGTEVFNVLDRNLAVQAFKGKPLPKQVLGFDSNDGAGFWWANSLNSFTRNVSCENDRYGYRFEATPGSRFKPTLNVRHADGQRKPVDIRTLPFVRFEDNESHCEGLYGVNVGEGVNRVGPDERHPFVLKNTKIWQVHYAYRPQSPSVLVDGMKIFQAVYGVYHPNFDRHVYRDLYIGETVAEPFNRGHDDRNQQYGMLSVDGLTLERCSNTLIQVSQYSPGVKAESHFRNVQFKDNRRTKEWVNTTQNGQPKNPPPDDVIPYYFHDHFGPGRHAKLLTASASARADDKLEYKAGPAPFCGEKMRLAEVSSVTFPKLLDPVDDRPPVTIITHVEKANGKLRVRGTTADNGTVKRVTVNGVEARAVGGNFAEWEADVTEAAKVRAHAEDGAGNVEKLAHERSAR